MLILTNPKNYFKNGVIETINGNVILVGDASFIFREAKKFNSDTNFGISRWDTSNVTDMNNMFYYANLFNSDISKWDTSQVTDMSWMFCRTGKFNSDK